MERGLVMLIGISLIGGAAARVASGGDDPPVRPHRGHGQPSYLQAWKGAGPGAPTTMAQAQAQSQAKAQGQDFVVDRIVEGHAVVVPLAGGTARIIPRALLPEGARDGDVVVHGRLAPDVRRAIEADLARLRERALSGAFSLDAEPADTRALTAGGER